MGVIRDLRDRLGLTQTEMATLLGISQVAVSGYENGTRNAAGRVLASIRRLEDAVQAATVSEELGRGKITTYPKDRWNVVRDDTVRSVSLPVRVDWSPRQSDEWHIDDVEHRQAFYALILDEGDAVDIQTYVDADELIEWADELPVARSTRPALDRLVGRLTNA